MTVRTEWGLVRNSALFNGIWRGSFWIYICAVVMIVLSTLAIAVSPVILGYVVDKVAQRDWHGVVPSLIALGVLQLGAGGIRSAAAGIAATRAERISHTLRCKITQSVFHLGEDHSAIEHQSRGKILSLINRDIEALWDLMGFAITEMVASVVMILALGTIVMYISVPVGLLFVTIAAIFSVAFVQNGKKIRSLFGQAAPLFDRMIGMVNSLLDGYETIASFRKQGWASGSIDALSEDVTGLAAAAHRRSARFSFVTGAINTIGVLIVWAIALPELMDETQTGMTLGGLIAILFYFSMLTAPLEAMSGAAKAVGKGTNSIRRIVDFENAMASTTDVLDNDIGPVFSQKSPVLRLRGVRDTPRAGMPDQYILAPTQLDLVADEVIGLAGASGSGKSTLLRVMARLKPADGTVFQLGGVPFGQLSETIFRDHVLYVPQQPAIFHANLDQNLFIGDADGRKAAAALTWAGLGDIGATLTVATEVTEQGLSGGEKQRLALARILNRSPRVFLIDEPTSALDYSNSRDICAAMIQHVKRSGASAVIASHDPHVLECCDRILVMQGGQIVEEGRFPDLSAQSDLFQTIIETKAD